MGSEEVVIIPYRDGPYLIRGPITLRDQDGTVIESQRRTVALCRCGKSRLRPFCDGTHQLARFRAPSEPETRGPERPESRNAERPESRSPERLESHEYAQPRASAFPSRLAGEVLRLRHQLSQLDHHARAAVADADFAEAMSLLSAAARLLSVGSADHDLR
jgi:CDGSH-type Zn-finger protein